MTIAEILAKLYPNLNLKIVEAGNDQIFPISSDPVNYSLVPTQSKPAVENERNITEYRMYAETKNDIAVTIVISKPYKIKNGEAGGCYSGDNFDYSPNTMITGESE